MKSITLNRYWQGMGTPNYAPGVYDESLMTIDRMTYLVTNGHATWRPDYDDADRDAEDAESVIKERELLRRVADGDREEWTLPPDETLTFKDASQDQMAAALALLEGRTPNVLLGEGLHLTDNERAILEATGHPVAPKAAPVSEASVYDGMTVAQLREVIKERGLTAAATLKRDDLVTLLKNQGT